jgi:hypothetical protein
MRELDAYARQLIDIIVDRTDESYKGPCSLKFLSSQTVNGAADSLADRVAQLTESQRASLIAYWDMRKKGTPAKLAEMFALQAPPLAKTEADMFKNQCNGSQFAAGPLANLQGDRYKAEAERFGVNVKGKVYKSGLARYPGDHQAWVTDASDVRKVLEGRGWNCSGAVEVKGDSRRDEEFLRAAEAPIIKTGGLSVPEPGTWIVPSDLQPEE